MRERERETVLLMKPSGSSQHHPLVLAQRMCFSLLPLSLLHAMSVLCTHALFIVAFINNLIEKQGEESHLNITGPNGTDRVP